MAASSPRVSAGILLYRRRPGSDDLEVALGHPGGPFFARKDAGAWSIPKGLCEPGSDVDQLATAVREFTEEVGSPPPPGPYLELGSVKQSSAKIVVVWAVEGDLDPALAHSNTFELQWPPRTGRVQSFPEIDRVEWFTIERARVKLNPGQVAFLDRLLAAVGAG
jgi:predicted NUDIX family NTP pyrophosphohydrolase